MPQIRPITDLRNTNEISELCHSLREPIFITKNGCGDLVLMSMETYDRDMAQVELFKKIFEAERQVSAGKVTIDGRKALKRLRDKYAE
ncbi:MAG: type II toxin-antitoxin system Phd/YefM family antitoxin [Negativicutes bacterium]|jgi:PHD/YefM family antitoxin component YafN of YafNO toxin-antitoxin module